MFSNLLSPAFVPWVSGGLAFLVTVGLTPGVRWAAQQGGWVATPEAEKWHDTPTTLLGGVAIVGGAAIVALSEGLVAFPTRVWGGAALLFGAGLADDLWGLRPATKLVVQVASVALVLSVGLLFAPSAPVWVSGPLTVIWVLGLTNALNLLDAMDGVAASVAAVAAVFLGCLAGLKGSVPLVIAAAAVAGATAGFLVFNVAPARIFMGDCGSLVLGYLLAVIGLGVQGAAAPTSAVLSPVLILAVPIFDTTFVSITRVRRGQSVSQGGTDHTVHRLVRLGWSERQSMLLMSGAGLMAGGIGLVGEGGPTLLFYALVGGAVATAVGIGYLLAQCTAPAAVESAHPETARGASSSASAPSPTQAEFESDEPVSQRSRA